jgi:outer membrane immunogenic protein
LFRYDNDVGLNVHFGVIPLEMERPMRNLFHTIVVVPALMATSISANAADVAVPPSVSALSLAYTPSLLSWNGFYIGGNFGGTWSQRNASDNLFLLNFSDPSTSGQFIGGGQAGFNYQVGIIVVGIEADFDWAANRNGPGNTVPVAKIGAIQSTFNDASFSSLAARFGVAYGQWFFYGKGGGALVGNDKFTLTNVTTGASITLYDSNASAWVMGAGIEWAFAPNWSLKIEYDYLWLKNKTFSLPTGVFLAGDIFSIENSNFQFLKLGVNYHFNYGTGRFY